MRHSVFGRKLSRTKNERRRLLQGLARELIRHGSLRTTLAKAKAVQPMVEKLITAGKLLHADAGTRFAGRSSGFTRIVKLGPRTGDSAEEAMLQFV